MGMARNNSGGLKGTTELAPQVKNNAINGEEIAKFMIVVKRKDEADVKTATTCERIDAAHWLTERCVRPFENQAPTSLTIEAIPMPVTPCQQRSAVH
ncbi:MAG: hypothetical protein CL879_01480 [Dehalococcoidia bacterium]|nr:hypothetical protein [Dehalococcoidia bacterium]